MEISRLHICLRMDMISLDHSLLPTLGKKITKCFGDL